MSKVKHPLALIILDGCGLNPRREGNAVAAADMPVLDGLKKQYPTATLGACGEDVGLMDGQMGDSNVGHLNIGAGRVVNQFVLRIRKAIEDGSFFENEVLQKAADYAAANDVPLHLMGLVSPGGVHSHQDHIYGLLELAKSRGVEKVFIHAFTDGRDVPPTSGKGHLAALQDKMEKLGIGQIADVSGRYFAMDRDRRWDRTQKAYNALVLGEALTARSATGAVQAAYDRDETDEFITPTVIVDDTSEPVGPIRPQDAVIFFNFRADRARQITRAFIEEGFDSFPRPDGVLGVKMATMTSYEDDFNLPYAFNKPDLKHTLGEIANERGWRQLRIAETEKYAHVTFFFNGGVESEYPGEVRKLIPSPKVATYDLQPEMSAPEVTRTAVEEIKTGEYDLIVLNFANMDMVGHTGVFDAAVKACEAVDKGLGQVLGALRSVNGYGLITADHGNSDQLIDYETGGPHTFHTLNRVPVVLVSDLKDVELRDGRLADLAPTLLELADVPKPEEMTGESLIVHKSESWEDNRR